MWPTYGRQTVLDVAYCTYGRQMVLDVAYLHVYGRQMVLDVPADVANLW